MVASVVLLLVHVPPTVALVNVVVEPTQAIGVPPIDAGNAFTVTGIVEKQPVAIT